MSPSSRRPPARARFKPRAAEPGSVARGRWTPFALALLCAHCAASGLLAALAVVGGGGALVAGVDVRYVWPPVLILGLFAWWLWSGRRAAAAVCDA